MNVARELPLQAYICSMLRLLRHRDLCLLWTVKASQYLTSTLVDMLGPGNGLKQLSTAELAKYFQVSKENPLLGTEARAVLLRSLGASLLAHPQFFGREGRPGNLVGK